MNTYCFDAALHAAEDDYLRIVNMLPVDSAPGYEAWSEALNKALNDAQLELRRLEYCERVARENLAGMIRDLRQHELPVSDLA